MKTQGKYSTNILDFEKYGCSLFFTTGSSKDSKIKRKEGIGITVELKTMNTRIVF